MGKKLEINTGDRFNRLTIIKEVEPHIYPSGNPRRRFLCKCDCGKEIKVLSNQFNGNTKSCGCWKIENGILLIRIRQSEAEKQGKKPEQVQLKHDYTPK
jgi:hypothetical protein